MKCKNCGNETNIPFYYAYMWNGKQLYLCHVCMEASKKAGISCDNCLLPTYKPMHPWYVRDGEQVYLCNLCMPIYNTSLEYYGKVVPQEDIQQEKAKPPIFFDARWKPMDKMPEFVGQKGRMRYEM